MTMESERCRRATGRAAAEWYVETDANPDDRARRAALTDWLERSPHHEAAFERCEAAVMIARELAARGELDDALSEPTAAPSGLGSERTRSRPQLSERARGALGVRPSLLEWAARPAAAWSVTVIAVIWAVAATVERDGPPSVTGESAWMARVAEREDAIDGPRTAGAPPGSVRNETMLPAGGADSLATETLFIADAVARDDGGVSAIEKWNPVGLLPGEIVVDAHSVAVLPFDGVLQAVERDLALQGAEESVAADRIALQLHDEVVRQLSLIPGVFVVDGRSSAIYADGEFGPDQIAAFLGVRGVVAADVSLDGRIVRVSLRMTDAVNEGRRTDTTFERPLDELPAVRTAIVSNIADTLASTAF